MITYLQGNLLEDNAEVLVNTVNTVGVMGKGIALAFKEAFPANFKEYKSACLAGDLRVGSLLITADINLFYGTKTIVNLPTKTHWRYPAEYSYIESGLAALHDWLSANRVSSIALPALGCSNGGLNWGMVKKMIEKHLNGLDIDIRVYEPA